MATGRTTWDSYGRTRRPKNIAGADGTAVSSVADVGAAKIVTDASFAAGNASGTGTGVYATENQRYLHLSSTTNGTVVNVWVYHYASAKWSELLVGGASVTLAAAKCKIVEIAGADLVAFKVTNAADVHAACSTF